VAPGRTWRGSGDHHLGAWVRRARERSLLGDRAGGGTVAVQDVQPWDEITSTAALTELLTRAGVARPAVTAVAGQHHIGHPDQFWDIVLGSGYRATMDALNQDQQDTVRECLLARLRAAGVTTLRADVVFGTAERPR